MGRIDRLVLPWLGVLAVFAAVGLLSVDLETPFALDGDGLFTVNFARAYADGQWFRFNAFLGFPGVQDNAYFPSFDFSYRLVLFIAARLTGNPFVAVQILYFVGTAAMFIAAYASLRRLGVAVIPAAAGAFAFVVTPYFVGRAFAHDFLALQYSVPLGATLALLLASETVEPRERIGWHDPFTLVSCVVVGTSGLYYAFFTAMFLTLGATCGALAGRTWRPLTAAMTLVAVIFALIVLSGYGEALGAVLRGEIRQVPRGAFETLLYGLSLHTAVGAVVPYLPPASAVHAQLAVASQFTRTEGSWEWPGAVLTLLILAAPVVVLAVAMSRWSSRGGRWGLLVIIAAAFIVFGLLYAVPGGLGFWFSLFVAPQIRAPARIMPFLTFFAVVVVTVPATVMLSSNRRLPRVLASLLLVTLVGASWPTFNALATRQDVLGQSDGASSMSDLLAVKRSLGSEAVLQLPAISWPEQPAVRDFSPYQHQLAHILDDPGATTRWSYGSTAAQEAFQVVAAALAEGPIVPAARKLGFDAVLIETRAYDGAELTALLSRLRGDGGCFVFADSIRLLFVLDRPTDESGCLGRNGPVPFDLERAFGAGWSVSEGTHRWSEGPESDIWLAIPEAGSGPVELSFEVAPFLAPGLVERSVEVRLGDDVLATWHFAGPERTTRSVVIPSLGTGQPALTFVHGDARSPLEMGAGEDPRQISIALSSASWVALEP